MQLKRMLGTATAVTAVAAAVVLYTVHPVKSSDHQDTYNLATRSNTSADITDVFVFPSPSNPNNVVFAMDVSPLIAPGTGSSHFFDPTLLYQFKIAHGTTNNYAEDQVIQVVPQGVDGSQTLTLYVGAPAQVGTTNTIIDKQPLGTAQYNVATTSFQNNTVSLFGGPRTDPFVFDLFGFFTFAGDRNYGTHTSQTDPGAAPGSPNAPAVGTNGDSASNIASLTPSYDKTPNGGGPSFNGFASGTMSNSNATAGGAAYNPALGTYACNTSPASDTLFAGPFDVLSIVVEVPKSMIDGSPYNNANIHVWATTSSSSQADLSGVRKKS